MCIRDSRQPEPAEEVQQPEGQPEVNQPEVKQPEGPTQMGDIDIMEMLISMREENRKSV